MLLVHEKSVNSRSKRIPWKRAHQNPVSGPQRWRSGAMRSISSQACSPGRIRERSRSRSSVRPRKACGGKGRRSSPPCPCSTFTSTALESTSTPHRETSLSMRRTSFGNSSAVAEERGARKDNPLNEHPPTRNT